MPFQRFKKGDPLKAKKFNQGIDWIDKNLIGAKHPNPVNSAALNKIKVVRVRVKTIEADYLTCRTWDGTTEGANDVLVAKPYLLRNAIVSRNGITYTYTSTTERTANDGTDTETQVLVPSYVVDDEIFAVVAGPGGTGADDGESPAVPLVFVDMNLDARAWAKKAE